MAKNIYGRYALTGGAAGALDEIDGAGLADKDMAIVFVQDAGVYCYILDADSGAAEASPGIIAPDTNAGDKRWILHYDAIKNLFDANTILAANSDNTPAAVTVAEQRIVGRITGGNIDDLTITQILDMIGSAANGDILYRTGGAWTRLGKGTDGQIQKLASGVPTWAWGGKIVQVVYTSTGSAASGSTAMPCDNTIPQKTEGDEYLTLEITPKSASNYLLIEVLMFFAYGTGGRAVMALFQDDTADALAASVGTMTADSLEQRVLTHRMVAGTTSATTFKIRSGQNGSGGQYRFNQESGGALMNGTLVSSIKITEIAA
jgi:hypothetical protein